ncbi:MAG: hypothetical protein RIS70_4378 [Planctomycetota bacterium]
MGRAFSAALGLSATQCLDLTSVDAWSRTLQKQNKQVLFIWLDGGISQLESWDPKPNTEFGGPFRAIATSVPGIHLSELMPKTARQMHHLAVVRSLCTQDDAHSSGVDRIQRGDPQNRGVVYPFFGSAVTKLLGPNDSGLPPYVWIKPLSGGFIYKDAGFLGPEYGSLAFGDGKPPDNMIRNPAVSEQDLQERTALRDQFDQHYAKTRDRRAVDANRFVFRMGQELMNRQSLFDPSRNSPRDVERYGSHDLGRHLLLARHMLEAGVRFVKVNSYGWDSHGDNFNGSLSLVPKFDQPFAAIIEDLAESGRLDNTLVIAMSEFGRTPRINGHLGRDHWPEAWSLVTAGCGIKRGLVVGETHASGTYVTTEPYDIGHMFHTWFHALGIDSTKVEYDNHGQPLPIANERCHAVKELLA